MASTTPPPAPTTQGIKRTSYVNVVHHDPHADGEAATREAQIVKRYWDR